MRRSRAAISGSTAAGAVADEDLGSTNGSYADDYEHKMQVALIHGNEAQTGECRLKLVSFAPDTPQHRRARQYLAKRDGLTGPARRAGAMARARGDDDRAGRGRGILTVLGRGHSGEFGRPKSTHRMATVNGEAEWRRAARLGVARPRADWLAWDP